jgi:hypothetical protein
MSAMSPDGGSNVSASPRHPEWADTTVRTGAELPHVQGTSASC